MSLRHFFALLLCPLFGCATPGMTLTWSVNFPPTQLGSQLIHPTTTLPVTTYAIETPSNVPLIQRQYQMVQPPVYPIASPGPQPVRLPMPKEGAASPPCNPCQE